MTRTLIAVAAGSALALSAAFAQTPTPGTTTKPDTQPPAASGTMKKPDAQSPGMQAQGMVPKPVVISSQNSNQLLASKFKGTDVIGTDNLKIGDVNDVLFERNGTVTAYVIGVGGFLGIGSKDVAVDPKSIELVAGLNGEQDKLRLAMSKDELTKAATFEPYRPPQQVRVPATGSSNRPRTPTSTQ